MCETTRLHEIKQETIVSLYKVMAVPSLSYGSECWIPLKKKSQQTEAAEMRFLMPAEDYHRTDQMRNEDISLIYIHSM
jgi:hypothetical protein